MAAAISNWHNQRKRLRITNDKTCIRVCGKFYFQVVNFYDNGVMVLVATTTSAITAALTCSTRTNMAAHIHIRTNYYTVLQR